ncbi:transposase [Desulfuromonas versatilis]|uniref:Transposase n=1 Tax=Desulfuromonas versatilis TaxID=2802975 RepID=A0ABM8HVN4_9BACT|nr:transposase [Desulfuromonas versatilis]
MVFSDPDDFRYYLVNLATWKAALDCKVYGYCLMTNHVHLIVDPGDNPAHLGMLMKRLAGRQTRYVNRLEGRSGTLWEGRYRSSPIENDAYLLACCRYVDLNPVQAGVCAQPADYPWSSGAAHLGGSCPEWLDLAPAWLGLGETDEERVRHYRDLLAKPVNDEERQAIVGPVKRGQLTGGDRFVDEVAERLGRRVELRGQGRPRKRGK